ncbi:hypothetical protein PCASD_11433 [Puccinia coronata f. sp. avenae]|uniref:Uncharacterized protein n=1 Tax=Puccinia coronata f. sp. avenae TaxID=200324 RepID=A0A2N5V0S4_9BASI|nr:hypothetical protein PCASD_11433 [Puccinia coronata f. sp. avenae]
MSTSHSPRLDSLNGSAASSQPSKHPENHTPTTRPVRSGIPYSSLSHQNRAQNSAAASPHANSKPSRSLITVIPPSSLPANPPQARSNSCSGHGGSPSAFSRGVLIPLYPTLASQMAAISREYGLPSAGGMMVYLVEASPTAGDLAKQLVGGPKISEAAWQILWSGVFEEEEAEAFERALQERENQLYYEPGQRQGDDYQEDIQEEALNDSMDVPSASPSYLPRRASHNRPPSFSPRTTRNFQEESSSTDISSSDDFKIFGTHNSTDRRHPLGQKSDDRHKLGNRSINHARSQSSCMAHKNNVNGGASHHSSADVPSRPSTSLSAQLPAGRKMTSTRQPNQQGPMSDRGSSYSSSSYRPRRIGAGLIVGKIEFDIDSSRAIGSWYKQWTNPSRVPRNNLSSSNLVDVARPLLLPNLITQRGQLTTSPKVMTKPSLPSPTHLGTSLPSPGPPGSLSRRQSGNSYSFLAFDETSPTSDLGHMQQGLPYLADDQDRPIEFAYRSSNKLAASPIDSGRIFRTNRTETGGVSEPNPRRQDSKTSPGQGSDKKNVSGRLISDNHIQAISLMEAQAHHQSLVDQIDAQLSSPIKLDPAAHHAYSFGSTHTTLPGLSLEVTGHADLAGSRYQRNQDGSGSSCTSSPETDPANRTHSSTGSSSNSSVDASDNHGLLLPGLWSSKRSSSVAIEANLKELEEALVTLSPRALRGSGPYVQSPLGALPAPNRAPATHGNAHGLYSNHGAPSAYLPEQVNRSFGSVVEEQRGGMSKFFDSLQESYQEMKTRAPYAAFQQTSTAEVPVGNTAGYTREDTRECHAPKSPRRSSRRNSCKNPPPRSSSFLRKNSTFSMMSTTSSGSEGFVSKLSAGIAAGKLRGSVGSSTRRTSNLDSI